MRAIAFCPGHITGFFQACLHEDALRSGSRGAGVCLNLGATSAVTLKKGTGKIEVRINGAVERGAVTRYAVSQLLEERKWDAWVSTALDLPVSQGLGRSAAGALASAIAVADMLELSREEAFRAAHEAEVVNSTGLGDVAAIYRGGVTFRKKEGFPPYGKVDRIASGLRLVAGVVGPSLKTSLILKDEEKRRILNELGQECYERLRASPSVKNFMKLSREFSGGIGMLPPRTETILREVEEFGPASVAMLGNSIFGTGSLEDQRSVLEKYGETFRLQADTQGPRVLVMEE